MRTIKITVDNNSDAQWLLDLFSKLKFKTSIEFIENPSLPEMPKGKFSSDEEFLTICGLWEGRDISAEKIREQAWRKIEV